MFGSYEVSGQRPEQATKIPFWYSLPIPERFLAMERIKTWQTMKNLEEAIMASAQASTTKKQAEEEMEKIDAEVLKVQQGAQEYIETLHKREDAALNAVMNEFDKWAKGEEQKERANVREIKQSLENLGATADMEQPLTELAKSLDKPLIGKDGKTYVAIPSPGKLLPLLKKVVNRMLGAFGWSHSVQKKTMEHVERARTSFKAKLPVKKAEVDQQNEARWAAERQMTQEQQPPSRKKNEPSL